MLSINKYCFITQFLACTNVLNSTPISFQRVSIQICERSSESNLCFKHNIAVEVAEIFTATLYVIFMDQRKRKFCISTHFRNPINLRHAGWFYREGYSHTTIFPFSTVDNMSFKQVIIYFYCLRSDKLREFSLDF